MEWLLFAVVWLPLMAAAQWLAVRRSREAAAVLEAWAKREGHQLLEARRAWFYTGPFWLPRGQAVFWVRLVTADGCRRMGWARVGRGHPLFPISDVVEVRWEGQGVAGS